MSKWVLPSIVELPEERERIDLFSPVLASWVCHLQHAIDEKGKDLDIVDPLVAELTLAVREVGTELPADDRNQSGLRFKIDRDIRLAGTVQAALKYLELAEQPRPCATNRAVKIHSSYVSTEDDAEDRSGNFRLRWSAPR